ncbi:type II toxin-antitoxin system RelE/ParE family toxin [bacterium]|nr:type II toxin-antitoxin system RelE/ParE family toxin [bacterium]
MAEPAYRELILGKYRIIYRFKSNLVEILTILHAARLLDPKRLR